MGQGRRQVRQSQTTVASQSGEACRRRLTAEASPGTKVRFPWLRFTSYPLRCEIFMPDSFRFLAFMRHLSVKSPWIRWLGLVGLAGILVLIVRWQVAFVGDWRVDDAYITFSFSKNLGLGRGPIYSHDVRVEGYSNFLWMGFLAVGYFLRPTLSVYATARTLCFISLALIAVSAWRLSRRHAGWLASAAGLVVLACSTDLTRASLSALETVPYGAVLTISVLWYLEESPDRAQRWSILGFVIAALMRIDGFVPLFYVVGFELVESFLGNRFRLRPFLRWLAPIGIYAAWFAWRWQYYGLFLPTTYYAKTLVSAEDEYRAYNYAWDFVRALGLQALLPLAFIAVARKPSRDTVFVALLILCHGSYVLQTGGDWMPFWRFFIPVLPLVMVLVAWGISEAWQACGRLPLWARAVPAAVISWCCFFCARHADGTTVDTPQEKSNLDRAAHELKHTRDQLLDSRPMIAAILRRPGERLVTDYGGVFALYTNASVIESWGLCNVDIALNGGMDGIHPVYGKSCPSCIAAANPDYFHTTTPLRRSPDAFRDVGGVVREVFLGSLLDRILDFRRNYAVGRVLDSGRGEALWFLERRRPDLRLEARETTTGLVVEYPFERGGRLGTAQSGSPEPLPPP